MSYNVRTFRAPSLSDALAAVKRELGPDAVILGTRHLPTGSLPAWAQRARVEITAAPAGGTELAPRVQPAPPPARNPRVRGHAPGHDGPAAVPRDLGRAAARGEPELSQDLYPHYVHLVQNAVAEDMAARLVQHVQHDLAGDAARDPAALQTALRNYIARLIPADTGIAVEPGRPRRVALVGPAGSGKTTTIAKLAALFKLRHGARVGLLSLDLSRLGAHEQLQRYADVLEIPLHAGPTIGAVKAALHAAPETDLLLIDTPGVGPREQARFARLASLLRAVRPDEIHLVLPASLAPEIQVRLAQGFAPLKPARVVLTHLDEVVGLGVVLNVVDRLHLGVSYLTAGQNVPQDIQEACRARLAELLSTLDK